MSEEIIQIEATQPRPQAIQRADMASQALAAQAEAQVKARYAMAFHHPRDLDQARINILKSCKRPGFAAVARYAKPVGGQKIEGWSIRAAEEFARHMTNILPEVLMVYDDAKMRIVRVSVTDLEANLSYTKDVTIQKTVERKKPKPGTMIIASRQNSYGEMVHIVQATDDEIMVKENALVSKAMRNAILRIVPSDILEDALNEVLTTANSDSAKDPSLARKKIADGFSGIGVMPIHLKAYLGHELDQSSPAEIADLRTVYQAIKDGETTWAEIMAARSEEQAGKEKEAKESTPPDPQSAPRTIADLKAKAKKSEPNDEPPPEHWSKVDSESNAR